MVNDIFQTAMPATATVLSDPQSPQRKVEIIVKNDEGNRGIAPFLPIHSIEEGLAASIHKGQGLQKQRIDRSDTSGALTNVTASIVKFDAVPSSQLFQSEKTDIVSRKNIAGPGVPEARYHPA